MKKGKISRILKRSGLAFTMAVTMAATSLPVSVMAAEDTAEMPSVEDRSVHDYGKSGDDPATPEDESNLVADENVFRSAQYQESTKYSLTANGTPISVYKYQKQEDPGKYYHMDVARFSSDDAQPTFQVTVNDGTTMDSVTIYPERYYTQEDFQISEDGKTLTFKMAEELRYCIVNINGTENNLDGKPQLAIINDPTETDAPDVNGANVLNFKTFSEQYLKKHPIKDKVGDTCRDAGEVTDTSMNNNTEYTWKYGEGKFEDYWAKEVKFPNKRARLTYDVSEAFQAALEEVRSSSTLNTIYFPAGTYVWSGLSIKDWDGNGTDGALNIYVDEDALMVNRMQECQEAMEPAIGIWDSSNITVSGRGIFDGQGTYSKTTDRADANKSPHQGGCMLVRSQNITFNDTYVRDVKQWNWECHTVENIVYNNIKGLSPFQHSWVDGLDLTSGKNVTVNGAITMGNDDTFAAGHYNPSDGFPFSKLTGQNLDDLSEEDKNIAAAAGVYNKDRLQWDTDDSEGFTVNNTLGWSTFANAVRLGHNTKWKDEGGSYQMKDYTFNNVNTLHVTGWSPNGGGGAFSIQNGTNGCHPDYQSLTFNNCSFTANTGNSALFPNGNDLNEFYPESVTLKNCWFKDAKTPVGFRKIQNVTIEDLYLGGKLVEYTSQVDLRLGEGKEAVDHFVFTANGEPVKDNQLPVITSPGEKIQAYAGNPLIFYLQAEDPDSNDTVTMEDADVSAMEGASFDPATGKFTWTPSEDEIGKAYEVTFTVSDHTEQPVRRTVHIEVDSPLNSAQSFMVSEDAHMQTWKGEKNLNFGNTRYLTTVLIKNQGLMGEQFMNTSTNDGTDGKMFYLKFDLSDMKEQKGLYDKAELVLTYLNKRDSKYGDVDSNLRVAVVGESEWNENTITWTNKPIFSAQEDNTKVSEMFKLGTAYKDKPSANDQAINGTKVKTDITDFVTDAIESGKDYLTLAVCETLGAEIYFVSREGAEEFEKASPDMAPAIQLNLPTAVDVEGPEGMTVKEGYNAADSDSFSLKGKGPFTVLLSCENGDGNITWNEETQQIHIEEGLQAGTYAVTLTVNNADGNEKTTEFILTVLENPDLPVPVDKTALQQLYDDNKDKAQGNYTDNSWNAFTEALTVAKDVLESEVADESAVSNALINLQKAADNLIQIQIQKTSLRLAVEMADNLREGSQEFTEESWNQVEIALEAARAILEDENACQNQVDEAFIGLVTACTNLEAGVQRSGLRIAISSAEAVLADEDIINNYTSESIQNVQDKLEAAKDILDTKYDDIEEGQVAVNLATNDLITAVTEMLRKDFGRLGTLIGQANAILNKPENFTPDSIQNLQEAVDAAVKVVEEQKADPEEIDRVYNDLSNALIAIQLRGNKSELETVLANAKGMLDQPDRYLSASLEGLQGAYDSAWSVFGDDNAVQNEIERVLELLLNECMEVRVLGDIDLNGKVETADSAMMLQYNAELISLTDEQVQAGDVNRDGQSDTTDASVILQMAAEKINTF